MTSEKAQDGWGPLILGSAGRVGAAFRTLWDRGLWPGHRPPLWHRRTGGDLAWDMLSGPAPDDPRLANVRGLIVLTGGTGNGRDLAQNRALARAAVALARREGIGPVLLCSSQAVYGRAEGPQSETANPNPASDYGRAKLDLEAAVRGQPDVCCLRIGNVAGTDMLLRNAALGPVKLDQFADGRGPRRCYIGPKSLAATMLTLIDAYLDGRALPAILNVSAPGERDMADLLAQAEAEWSWTPAPPSALPSLSLDLGLLNTLAPLPENAGSAQNLITEARDAGWRLLR